MAEVQTCYRHPDEPTRVRCTRCDRPICPDCMTPAPVGHHCPACVAEGRRDLGRRRLTLRSPRSLTRVLLGVNVAVFALSLVLGTMTGRGALVRLGAMVPALVAGGEYWRLVTAMFLHIGVAHLLFNMVGLYIFGGLIEQALGTRRFAAIYLVAGFCASAVSFAFGATQRIAVGASGAIFGLLGAWLAYNLRRRSTGMAQGNIQGALVLVSLNLVLGFTIPGIDNLAHVGGLAAGFLAELAAEGAGRGAARIALQAAGLVALLLVGVALTVWRVVALS